MQTEILNADALADQLIAEHAQHATAGASGAAPAAMGATAGTTGICFLYNKIAPILKLVLKLVSIFKPKWVAAMQPFFDVMDASCTADPATLPS